MAVAGEWRAVPSGRTWEESPGAAGAGRQSGPGPSLHGPRAGRESLSWPAGVEKTEVCTCECVCVCMSGVYSVRNPEPREAGAPLAVCWKSSHPPRVEHYPARAGPQHSHGHLGCLLGSGAEPKVEPENAHVLMGGVTPSPNSVFGFYLSFQLFLWIVFKSFSVSRIHQLGGVGFPGSSAVRLHLQ